MEEIRRVTVEDGHPTPFERIEFDDAYILGYIFKLHDKGPHLTQLVMYPLPGNQISVYVSNAAVDDTIDVFRRAYLAIKAPA